MYSTTRVDKRSAFLKMQIYVFVFLVVTAVAIAFPNKDKDASMPLDLLSQKEIESLNLQMTPIKEHHRMRRFTCDFLSGWGVDHSACAAHCYARGKTGGRCNSDRVCVCRAKSWFG
ncbi:defensin-like [Cataglyphis hispanica]|nr:defensin-like [Cataglyphis hispanica]